MTILSRRTILRARRMQNSRAVTPKSDILLNILLITSNQTLINLWVGWWLGQARGQGLFDFQLIVPFHSRHPWWLGCPPICFLHHCDSIRLCEECSRFQPWARTDVTVFSESFLESHLVIVERSPFATSLLSPDYRVPLTWEWSLIFSTVLRFFFPLVVKVGLCDRKSSRLSDPTEETHSLTIASYASAWPKHSQSLQWCSQEEIQSDSLEGANHWISWLAWQREAAKLYWKIQWSEKSLLWLIARE